LSIILQEEEWKSKHRESLRKEKSQKQRVEEKKEQEESTANWPKVRAQNSKYGNRIKVPAVKKCVQIVAEFS
jgi:hypothetical protein